MCPLVVLMIFTFLVSLWFSLWCLPSLCPLWLSLRCLPSLCPLWLSLWCLPSLCPNFSPLVFLMMLPSLCPFGSHEEVLSPYVPVNKTSYIIISWSCILKQSPSAHYYVRFSPPHSCSPYLYLMVSSLYTTLSFDPLCYLFCSSLSLPHIIHSPSFETLFIFLPPPAN